MLVEDEVLLLVEAEVLLLVEADAFLLVQGQWQCEHVLHVCNNAKNLQIFIKGQHCIIPWKFCVVTRGHPLWRW